MWTASSLYKAHYRLASVDKPNFCTHNIFMIHNLPTTGRSFGAVYGDGHPSRHCCETPASSPHLRCKDVEKPLAGISGSSYEIPQ